MENFFLNDIYICSKLDEWVTHFQYVEGVSLIVVCTSGHLSITLDEEIYELDPYDLLFSVPTLHVVKYQTSPDFSCHVFSFPIASLNDVAYSCLHLESHWYEKLVYIAHHPVIHLTERYQRLGRAYMELASIYQEQPGVYHQRLAELLTKSVIFELLAIVNEHQADEPIAIEESIGNSSRQVFYQFITLLENNHQTRYPVAWYADKLAVTPKYLTHICHEVSQRTPSDVINDIAIRQIKHRLINTDDAIKQIASDMNFSTTSSFCKYFHQKTGVSADVYRKQNRVQ